MPELRKDPIVGRWVIIATERARRPGNFVDTNDNVFEGTAEDCPFCHNHDKVIHSIRNDDPALHSDWKVLVVASGTPILRIDQHFQHRGHGIYDVLNGYGAHEVVIESPQHIANMADLSSDQIKAVLQAYAFRINDLEKDHRLQYVLAYKNYGWTAGARRIGHCRSQIVATPVNPLRVKEKLIGAKKYYDYRERCIYCDLIDQEQNDKQRVILDSQHFIAVIPFAARFLFETWILPKRHCCDFTRGVEGLEPDLAAFLKEVLLKIKVGLNDPAYNFVIQNAPFRRAHDTKGKWKTIEDDYHWHIEIMPRLTRVAGFEKGTGFYIFPFTPANITEYF